MLAARHLIAPLWPAAIVVAMTLILGRFFCGWVCPLGTLLDYFHRLLRPITRRTNQWSKSCVSNSRRLTAPGSNARYVILIAVLLAAVFAFPLVGFVDPFSLLVRGLAFWGDPMLFRGANAGLGQLGGHWGSGAVEPFVRKHLLPYDAATFQWGGLSAAILATIFALEFVGRRFWCRYLCPTGAMLGLLGRRPLLNRVPRKVCSSCGLVVQASRLHPVQPRRPHHNCATMCRMDAVEPAAGFAPKSATCAWIASTSAHRASSSSAGNGPRANRGRSISRGAAPWWALSWAWAFQALPQPCGWRGRRRPIRGCCGHRAQPTRRRF